MNARGLYKFYFEELKWCGCGNPEEAVLFMGKVLDILRSRSDESAMENSLVPYERSPWKRRSDELQAALAGDDMLRLSYMYLLDAHDLTEHGGNVMGAWLTPKGAELLAAIKAHGEEGWTEMHDDEPV